MYSTFRGWRSPFCLIESASSFRDSSVNTFRGWLGSRSMEATGTTRTFELRFVPKATSRLGPVSSGSLISTDWARGSSARLVNVFFDMGYKFLRKFTEGFCHLRSRPVHSDRHTSCRCFYEDGNIVKLSMKNSLTILPSS